VQSEILSSVKEDYGKEERKRSNDRMGEFYGDLKFVTPPARNNSDTKL